MKLYNRELEEIENLERYNRIKNIIEKQIEFLVQAYDIDEQMLRDRAERLAIVERNPKESTYFTEENGIKKENPNPRSVAAFVTIKRQEYDGEKWEFENGVYISDSNSEHKIIHELFHFLSQKQQMEFNSNGVGYAKSGISISGYDREDNLVDTSLKAKGLNEGITELLATKVDSRRRPDAYSFQTYIADILISNKHRSLLDAYFSDDEKVFRDFLDEFGERQQIISSQELIEMSTDGQVTVSSQLLRGCLEYALSFCKDIDELKAERIRLIPIFKNMLNNLDIEFETEDFDLKQFFNEILLEKRREIEGLMHMESKDVLSSAIQTTEEVTKTSTINEQVKTIEELTKESVEKTEEMEKM